MNKGKKDKKKRERKNKGKTRETKEVFSITDAINMSFSIVIIFQCYNYLYVVTVKFFLFTYF